MLCVFYSVFNLLSTFTIASLPKILSVPSSYTEYYAVEQRSDCRTYEHGGCG